MRNIQNALSLFLGLAVAVSAAAATSYENGVYRDIAPGYNDEVIVTVTVREGKIVELTAENKDGEESEYFQKAEAGMADQIIQRQGVDGVDAVSGATGTSQSILTAMEGILEQMRYTGPDAASGQDGTAAADANGTDGASTPDAGMGGGDAAAPGASTAPGTEDGGAASGAASTGASTP